MLEKITINVPYKKLWKWFHWIHIPLNTGSDKGRRTLAQKSVIFGRRSKTVTSSAVLSDISCVGVCRLCGGLSVFWGSYLMETDHLLFLNCNFRKRFYLLGTRFGGFYLEGICLSVRLSMYPSRMSVSSYLSRQTW